MMLNRRDMLKLGLAGGSFSIISSSKASAKSPVFFSDMPASPPTTPFVMDLPVPPITQTVAPFAAPECAASIGPGTKFYHIVEEERLARYHPELPPTLIWSYRDVNTPPAPAGSFLPPPGPTFKAFITTTSGNGVIVRHTNNLPANHTGFGEPRTTCHLHSGHHEARSDGFPANVVGLSDAVIEPGASRNYCYPMIPTGFSTGQMDTTDIQATMWYHDHLLDFTGQNVYRGLVGCYLVFDSLDTGDETTGLRLPSGNFDIPLVLTDKRFAADGSLVFDPFNTDGFLGDKFCVNGGIQPRLRVKRRKYRFRILDGGPARFWQLFLVKANGQEQTFDMIATEGGLLAHPIRGITDFQIGIAERRDIVIDFSRFPGVTELYLENRQRQDDGRGPNGLVNPGTRILKFILEDTVADPSQVPDTLRPFTAITQAEINAATLKTFVFKRQNGAWVINNQFVDINNAMTISPRNAPEIWRLVNQGGGWWHPIHVHLEAGRVLKRNGQIPPLHERDGMARKDTHILGPNDTVDVFYKFRDYPGPFVFHCHNLAHEDMFMMARQDVS